MSHQEIPLVVRCLEDRVKEWHSTQREVLIIPKKANFDMLFFEKRSIKLTLDTKDEYRSIALVVPNREMDEDHETLFRSLKNMECELTWEGILKRKPRFRSLPALLDLKNHIPQIKLDDKLAQALNSDAKLLEFVQKLKPESVTVYVTAFPGSVSGISTEHLRSAIIESYYHPANITWHVILTKVLLRWKNYKTNICRIYDILDTITSYAKKLTPKGKAVRKTD